MVTNPSSGSTHTVVSPQLIRNMKGTAFWWFRSTPTRNQGGASSGHPRTAVQSRMGQGPTDCLTANEQVKGPDQSVVFMAARELGRVQCGINAGTWSNGSRLFPNPVVETVLLTGPHQLQGFRWWRDVHRHVHAPHDLEA